MSRDIVQSGFRIDAVPFPSRLGAGLAITTLPMIGGLRRRGSSIQANPAGAQPRSTYLPNRACRSKLDRGEHWHTMQTEDSAASQ